MSFQQTTEVPLASRDVIEKIISTSKSNEFPSTHTSSYWKEFGRDVIAEIDDPTNAGVFGSIRNCRQVPNNVTGGPGQA